MPTVTTEEVLEDLFYGLDFSGKMQVGYCVAFEGIKLAGGIDYVYYLDFYRINSRNFAAFYDKEVFAGFMVIANENSMGDDKIALRLYDVLRPDSFIVEAITMVI